MGTKALMTAAQFGEMRTAETEDFELVDGELVRTSSGTIGHNQIRDLLGYQIWSYFLAHRNGQAVSEIDCRLGEDIVHRPDLSIFLGDRLRTVDANSVPAPFAPDIAVEVLSPSESAIDVRRKVRDYLRAGSQEMWLVDAANGEVMFHVPGGIRVLQGAEILETAFLPGFSMSVETLLA